MYRLLSVKGDKESFECELNIHDRGDIKERRLILLRSNAALVDISYEVRIQHENEEDRRLKVFPADRHRYTVYNITADCWTIHVQKQIIMLFSNSLFCLKSRIDSWQDYARHLFPIVTFSIITLFIR